MKNINELTIDIVTLGLANESRQPALMPRPHKHNEVEINFVEHGTITYLFGGNKTVVQAGQLAIFWATLPHQLISYQEKSIFHWLTLPFSTFLRWQLSEFLAQQVICGKFVTMPVRNQASTLALFQQWNSDLRLNTPGHRQIVLLEVEAYLRRQLLDFSSATIAYEIEQQKNGTQVHEFTNIEQMACFIADHYTEPIHVETVAQEVHLHPNYAQTIFRKHFGMSIVDYITRYRIAHAQRLLVTTNATTSAIALEAGFGSVSRFYTAFQQACSQSPGAYRAELKMDE